MGKGSGPRVLVCTRNWHFCAVNAKVDHGSFGPDLMSHDVRKGLGNSGSAGMVTHLYA